MQVEARRYFRSVVDAVISFSSHPNHWRYPVMGAEGREGSGVNTFTNSSNVNRVFDPTDHVPENDQEIR